MATYATKEQVQTITSPVCDVEVSGLTYQLEAITRGQFKWAMDEIGYVDNEVTGKQDSADPEAVDMLMLALCIQQPPFDPNDEADIETLRGLPIGISAKLIKKMMTLSGLREEDPTPPTEG